MTQPATLGALPAGAEVEMLAPRRRWRVRGLPYLTAYGIVLLLFVGAGLFAPLVAPQDPNAQALTQRLRPPAWDAAGSWDHPFGTDNLGRDVLSRVIYGA